SGARRGAPARAASLETRATCLLPERGGALVGTARAHLLRLRGGESSVLEGFDRADGRREWYTPWGGPPDVRSLARGADGALYANVHVGGVLRSGDRGASWRPTLDIDADVHQVLAHPRRAEVVLAACARGLATSTDGARSWTYSAEGLHASYARAVAVADGTVFLSASTGPSTRRAALYRRALRGAGALEKCAGGLPAWFTENIDSHCVAATARTVAFGTADGSVFVSADGGSTWRPLAERLPPVRALALLGGSTGSAVD
ncbi:MAG: WD40/YVTN/BNR-like repeat-containing protein, partial [Candidatus Limnocylindria bacterium]